MSRESKILTATTWSPQQVVSHYECFGWELLSLNGNQISMSRETQNPVYSDLVKLQAEYEATVAEYEALSYPHAPVKPASVTFKNIAISFICLIIPCIIYVWYKINQHNKYKEAMAAYDLECKRVDSKKQELLKKIDSITLQGRTVFFSRQQ